MLKPCLDIFVAHARAFPVHSRLQDPVEVSLERIREGLDEMRSQFFEAVVLKHGLFETVLEFLHQLALLLLVFRWVAEVKQWVVRFHVCRMLLKQSLISFFQELFGRRFVFALLLSRVILNLFNKSCFKCNSFIDDFS